MLLRLFRFLSPEIPDYLIGRKIGKICNKAENTGDFPEIEYLQPLCLAGEYRHSVR